MWKSITICALLSLSTLAQAQVPTADNWESLSPERCDPDPQDNLNLTPLIFPPVFKTVQVPYTPDGPVSEVIIVPAHTRKNGERIPAIMVERIIPNMGHMRSKRTVGPHYLGFLDPAGGLVDERGQDITPDNPMTAPVFDDVPESFEILERRINPRDPAYKDFSDVSHTCRYHIEYAMREARIKLMRVYARQPQITCDDNGGYKLSPIQSNDIERRDMIKIRDTRVTIWDHKGHRYSGSAEELSERFNRLSESGKCDWTQAAIE